MSKANGFLAVRIAVALCAVLTVILWAAGQYPGGERRQVSGPEDLRAELARAQLLAPPSDSAVEYDAGSYAWAGGAGGLAREFAAGLVLRLEADGRETWPVTVFEDDATRATVFLNADGAEVLRLAAEEGLGPTWAARFLFPWWSLSQADEFQHAESRVVMSARLVEPGVGHSRIWNGAARAGAPSRGPSSAPPGYKDYLVVWDGPSNVWAAGDAGAAASVAAVDAGYSHGVALHDDGSLTRVGADPGTCETAETRYESAAAALASAGALGDTFVLGFDGALKRVSGFGELVGDWRDAGHVVRLASGTGFLLALRNDGTVLCRGGDGSPVPPDGLHGVAGIDAGAVFGVALRHNGSLTAWGDARVATNIASGVGSVSASKRGAHCLALLKNGGWRRGATTPRASAGFPRACRTSRPSRRAAITASRSSPTARSSAGVCSGTRRRFSPTPSPSAPPTSTHGPSRPTARSRSGATAARTATRCSRR